MKKRTWYFGILVFLFTSLTACGGGSGGSQSPAQSVNTPTPASSPVVTPVVTPPVVTPPAPVVTPPPTPTKLTIKVDATSPVPTEITRINTDYLVRTMVVISNPTSAEQGITIPSISVKGSLASEVASVQIIDGNTVLGTAVPNSGKAYFQSISLNIPTGSSKEISIYAKLNPSIAPLGANVWSKKVSFGFDSSDIIPSSAPISGLPVWGSYAYLDKGIEIYPCPDAKCYMDTQTGAWKILVVGGSNALVPLKNGSGVGMETTGYYGENVSLFSLPNLSQDWSLNSLLSWKDGNAGCGTWYTGLFDFTENGDAIVFTSTCKVVAVGSTPYIGLLKTDGSGEWIRITRGSTKVYSPTIGSHGGVASNALTILYVQKDGANSNIWKVVVNTNTSVVGKPTMLVGDVFSKQIDIFDTYSRLISVNKDYAKMVFVRKVNGVNHLFVTSINGGKETDIGVGFNPYWAVDGSNRILFTSGGLWIMDVDGTNRRKMILPANISTNLFAGGVRNTVMSATYPLIP